jgi:MFS family permease
MKINISARMPFHYGWAVVGAGTLTILACLGFGRFALGMLLPSMAGPLELDYRQMGLISTVNFSGYLASVLFSGYLAVRLGPSRLIFMALLLVGATMALVGVSGGFYGVLVLYALTGLGSGAANIPTMGLVSSWFSRRLRGKAAGFIVIGSGFAIIIAGLMIPYVNHRFGDWGWRMNWLILAAAVLMIAVISRMVLRDSPEDVGLGPLGHTDLPPRDSGSVPALYRIKRIYHLGVLYFLFGFTYAIYVTFIVTSLVRDRGFSEVEAGRFWMLVGVLSLFSGPVFGMLSDRFGRRAGFVLVFMLQATAYIFAALGLSKAMLYMSVCFFGLGAWSIPGIMAATVGDCVGAARAPQAFGVVTFIFALGQISGPWVAGVLAEQANSFTASFTLAASMSALAVAFSLMLKGTGRTWESEAR